MGCGDSKQNMQMPKGPAGTLYYFDGHGRAEFIRLMLRKADVEFTDHRFDFPEWGKAKPGFPPGGLPCWDDGVMKYNETPAVARYLAKMTGFHGCDPKQCWLVDSTFDFLYDMWKKMAIPTVNKNMDDDASKGYFDATDKVIAFVTKRLTTMKTKFLCGNKMTTPDFQMCHIAWTYWRNDIHSCGDFYTKPCMEKIKASDAVFMNYIKALDEEMHHIMATRKSSPF